MITIKEMAEIAGVSPTTVANVLHGRTKKVSEETRKKVQKVIEKSNYVSNMGARLLGNYGSRIIAVIISYNNDRQETLMQDPFVGAILGAMEKEMSKSGYFMMLYMNPNVMECLHMAMAWNVEGIILLGVDRSAYYEFRSRLEVPMVTIDTYFKDSDTSYANVGLQDFEGGYMVTEYLLDKGHREIAFLSVSDVLLKTTDAIDVSRYQGYKKALMEKGIKVDKERVRKLSKEEKERLGQLEDFARSGFGGCTSLFFASDSLAIEALNIFQDMGHRVPSDISIVGFDNISASCQCRPKLTTVQQDIFQRGEYAIKVLMEQMEKKSQKAINLRLPVELIERDSVAEKVNKEL